MKLNLDTVQFESRLEVENIWNALEEFLTWRDREEFDEDMIDDVKKLRDKLQIMEFNW